MVQWLQGWVVCFVSNELSVSCPVCRPFFTCDEVGEFNFLYRPLPTVQSLQLEQPVAPGVQKGHYSDEDWDVELDGEDAGDNEDDEDKED